MIENVNDANENNAALHASGECEVSEALAQTGTWKSTDCSIIHDENQGCGSRFTEPFNYGQGFNINGGGVSTGQYNVKNRVLTRGTGLCFRMDKLRDQNLVFRTNCRPSKSHITILTS